MLLLVIPVTQEGVPKIESASVVIHLGRQLKALILIRKYPVGTK
jgi:hypothetical protein